MISVLLADDQQLVRTGFRVLLEASGDVEVVGEAADGARAAALWSGRTRCCKVRGSLRNAARSGRA